MISTNPSCWNCWWNLITCIIIIANILIWWRMVIRSVRSVKSTNMIVFMVMTSIDLVAIETTTSSFSISITISSAMKTLTMKTSTMKTLTKSMDIIMTMETATKSSTWTVIMPLTRRIMIITMNRIWTSITIRTVMTFRAVIFVLINLMLIRIIVWLMDTIWTIWTGNLIFWKIVKSHILWWNTSNVWINILSRLMTRDFEYSPKWKHFLSWGEKYHHLIRNSWNLNSYHPNSKHMEKILVNWMEEEEEVVVAYFQIYDLTYFHLDQYVSWDNLEKSLCLDLQNENN